MSDSVHVIVGATGGIGSAVVRRLLAGEGAAAPPRLVLVARGEERLQALAAELGRGPGEVLTVSADATRPEAVASAFEQANTFAAAGGGRITGVVHCVGSVLLKSAHITSDAEWLDTISLNLHSAFYVLREAVKRMRRTPAASAGGGSIVLMSSAAGRLGLANHEAIAAAKAGVQGLMLSAAATYAPQGIRVNAVAPGLVRTPMTARITENEGSRKVSESLHALKRIGEPDEVASAIAWLLDPRQSWVTGQIIGVDGGLATVRSA